MSIRDGYYRKVSIDTREELGNKIDELAVMIGKLATRKSGTNRQFEPQIHQSKGRGQNRSYSQRSYQILVDKIVEESTEMTTEMTVMVEVGTGPERHHFPEIMAIIELEAQAIVDPELVQMGIEYVVISVWKTIILQETVPLLERKGKLSNFKECSIWEMNKQ